MAEQGDIGVDNARLVLSDGDLLIRTRSESVKQRVRIALLHVLGEWFRDPSLGIDWFRQILTRPYQQAIADREIRRTILSVPGVASIVRLDFQLGPNDRVLRIRASYRDRYSNTETVEVNSP